MRSIRLALQLLAEGTVSRRKIATKCGVSRKSLDEYQLRMREANLFWPLPANMDDAELEAHLFPSETSQTSKLPQPDWQYIHQQMNSFKGATLKVLHEEYLRDFSEGMQYVRFCQLYKSYIKKHKVTLRFSYDHGSVVFVDYAGSTVPVKTSDGQEEFKAQIFVAALGASGLVYAEATRTQQIPDWLASHQRMFMHFGGTPRTVVCDNLKSAVIVASYSGEPVVNEAYSELAMHYGVNIVPARPKHPQDKSKVEQAVLMVTRTVLFVLRHKLFTSLHDLNLEISKLVNSINSKPVRRTGITREQLFESSERSALKALPATAWEYSVYQYLRVGSDYHINFKNHAYSVPYTLAGEQVEIRAAAGIIDILFKGRHVASHIRSYTAGRSTNPNHLHPNHKAYLDWNPEESLRLAVEIGPSCNAFLREIFGQDTHIDHRRRASRSLQSMAREYTPQRLEAACARAVSAGVHEVTFVRNLLRNRREALMPTGTNTTGVIREHSNLRSSSEFGLHILLGGKNKC